MSDETRTALEEGIERTLDIFHRLLVMLPYSALALSGRDSASTNGGVRYEITVPPLKVRNILRRNRGPWNSSLLARIVTGSLIEYYSEAFIRSHARSVTLTQPATAYQHNCDLILRLLGEIQE